MSAYFVENTNMQTENVNEKQVNGHVIEKPIRSIMKTLSWRATGTMDTIIVSYIVTGSAKAAFSVGFAELFTKMFLYYLHERVWSKLKFGKEVVRPPEYEI